MAKLNCHVPSKFKPTLNRGRIVIGAKNKALKKFVALALADTAGAPDVAALYGVDEAENCTIDRSKEEMDNAQKYRVRYALTTKQAFLLHAILHGGYLWERENPA